MDNTLESLVHYYRYGLLAGEDSKERERKKNSSSALCVLCKCPLALSSAEAVSV